VEVSALTTMSDGKQDVFAYESTKTGEALSAVLTDIVALALKKLPIPKLMRWADLRLPVRASGTWPDHAVGRNRD
jgi:glycyl-tRNA synthetase beta chain